MPSAERNLPRPASLTRVRSLATWSALRNLVNGTASLVSLSIITAMPTPQFGWQPQVRLPHSAPGRDLLVAARERHGLEREEVDLSRVVERELDDPPDLLVVDAVDDRDH